MDPAPNEPLQRRPAALESRICDAGMTAISAWVLAEAIAGALHLTFWSSRNGSDTLPQYSFAQDAELCAWVFALGVALIALRGVVSRRLCEPGGHHPARVSGPSVGTLRRGALGFVSMLLIIGNASHLLARDDLWNDAYAPVGLPVARLAIGVLFLAWSWIPRGSSSQRSGLINPYGLGIAGIVLVAIGLLTRTLWHQPAFLKYWVQSPAVRLEDLLQWMACLLVPVTLLIARRRLARTLFGASRETPFAFPEPLTIWRAALVVLGIGVIASVLAQVPGEAPRMRLLYALGRDPWPLTRGDEFASLCLGIVAILIVVESKRLASTWSPRSESATDQLMTAQRMLACILALIGIFRLGILVTLLPLVGMVRATPLQLLCLAPLVFFPVLFIAHRATIAGWILGRCSDHPRLDHRGLLAIGCAGLGVYFFLVSMDVTMFMTARGAAGRTGYLEWFVQATGAPHLGCILLIVTARYMPRLVGWGQLTEPARAPSATEG